MALAGCVLNSGGGAFHFGRDAGQADGGRRGVERGAHQRDGGAQPALTPINVDIHTAAPWHCLALCQLRTGDLADAEKSFIAAIATQGRTNEARVDFAKFLAEQSRAVDALKELHAAITADATHAPAWRLGGQIALDWTSEAQRHLPEDTSISTQRAEVLLLAGHTRDAVAAWQSAWQRDRLPRSLAALNLCQLVEGMALPVPGSAAEEEQLSRAFIGWYQCLLGIGAAEITLRVNDNLAALAPALPTAQRILLAALNEAKAEPAPSGI